MPSSHGIVIEIVGDEKSYLRSAQHVISTNTKMDASFKQVGVNANLSADAQIKAQLKVQEALKVNAAALSARAASLPGGSKEQAAATVLAAEAQAKYARSVGITTGRTHELSRASKTAERDIAHATRGALAGSRAFSGLGRTLAFASGGFIAFEVGVGVIDKSIVAAEDLEKANRSLAVAIAHTSGSVAKLTPQYQATAEAAAQFGVSQVEALTGLARATVLTGDAEKAQRAYQEALVISKALGKDFNATLTATAKGQEGLTTSLKRYGVILDTTATGQEQFDTVMKRFAGQAAANTTESDKLRTSIANFEATLGTELLPTFNRLSHRLTDWLEKMQKSGKLQRDVNHAVSEAGHVFRGLEGAVRLVDKVTGSFANTLKLLIGLKLASVLAGWASGFKTLAGAEALAGGAAAAGGAAGGAGVAAYTGAGAAASAAARGGGGIAALGRFGVIATATFGGIPDQVQTPHLSERSKVVDGWRFWSGDGGRHWIREQYVGYDSPKIPTNFGQLPPVLGGPGGATRTSTAGFAAGVTRIRQITQFSLSHAEQLAEAQAALTRSTTDDVAGARAVVARIKREIDHGRLHGGALIQALQAEASAMSTIWSAEDAAAQKRAAAAQAAKDRIAAQIQDSIDPLRLEVALSRAQALGKPLAGILRQIRASARAALRSGKLSLEQQKEAWDEIKSINDQLASQSKHATTEYKQLKTRALTAGLGLTDAQRAELRARLSQLGPGQTGHHSGTGAYGYEIGAHSHRPIHVHTTVRLDGKKVASNTTKHQERRRSRNSSQRRGPNAG